MKCPACNEEISLLAALKTMTPYFLKCSGCRTVARINMRGLHALVVLAACVVLGGLVASYYALRFHDEFTGAVVVCGSLGAFLLFECLALWLLGRHAHLTISRLGPNVSFDPVEPPAAMQPLPPESPPNEPENRSPRSPD